MRSFQSFSSWRASSRLSAHVGKTPRIRIAIDHELRQCLGRIQGDILPLLAHAHEVHAVRLEAGLKLLPMRPRGDHDSRLPDREPAAREAPHRVKQVRILFVELNPMIERTEVAPVRAWHRGLSLDRAAQYLHSRLHFKTAG